MIRKKNQKMHMLIVLVFLISTTGNIKADFTFGEPTNLGPIINSPDQEHAANISADGLSLFLTSDRSGGLGSDDIWVTNRATINDPWSEPVNIEPPVNSFYPDGFPSISADGLTLYFSANNRPGGTGGPDLWITTRASKSVFWQEPVNLGSPVNSAGRETTESISADGLSLYFDSDRPGGSGDSDLWVTTRATTNDNWNTPVNLGPIVNSSSLDRGPSISSDGLTLFFESERPGGSGGSDIWMTRRATKDGSWNEPVNLGTTVNTARWDKRPNISADGRTLYFSSYERPGGYGNYDIWQAAIKPICDLNNDLKIDSADMHIMIDHWGENYSLCDIGPTPLGDGVVDIHDFIVLSEHLYRLTAHWKLDEADGSIAYDSFGEYDGTINGNPSWMSTGGMKGGSLMLDGMDDYIETPFILDPSKGSFSVFAWVYCWMPGQVIISQKGDSGGTWLGTNPLGRLMTGLGDVNFGVLESESFITDVQWHHVGFVYDIDTLHRRLYVNGILVAEDTNAVAGESSNDGLYIGASKDLGAGTLFSGMIDDVRIYNQALTAEEITTLAQ